MVVKVLQIEEISGGGENGKKKESVLLFVEVELMGGASALRKRARRSCSVRC